MVMFLLFLLFSIISIASTKTTDVFGPVQVNEPFPSFRGWSVDGKSIGLTTFQKQESDNPPDIVIVSYFATWCLPCRKGIPTIEKIARAENITAIYISIDAAKDEGRLQSFANEMNIVSENPIIWDKFKKIAARHGVVQVSSEKQESQVSIPKTFLIRPDGKVHSIFIQEGDDFEQQLHNHIQDIQSQNQSNSTHKTTDVVENQ